MLGLQIYTVRDKMTDEKSAYDTVKEIKRIGYDAIQLAGTLDTMVMASKAAAKAAMPICGILVGLQLITDNREGVFAFAKEIGVTDVGISSNITTDSEVKELISFINEAAAVAAEHGLTFSYHNHSNEFIRGECGKTLISQMIEGINASNFYFMPDTYWIQHGGAEVRGFVEELSGRIKILHLKDMKRGENAPTFAPIGEGNLNFEGIVKAAKEGGVDCFVVEQDICECDSLLAAEISYKNLSKII